MTPGKTPAATLLETAPQQIESALAGDGLWLDVGLATLRVRSSVRSLAAPLQSAYRHFPLRTAGPWADVHVALRHGRGLRRWFHRQVTFHCDGQQPFAPFPADTALPLFEWGANWTIGRRFNDGLLLHAGVVERDGLALVLPALPGSGKSTLTAALALRGWRLLSDEFGAYDLQRRAFRPVLKPVALKNESIAVIRDFAPDAELGPAFEKTRKGTVAHLAPPLQAVRRVHEFARPGAVVLPRWQAGSATRLEPVQTQMAFSALAFNAFNYSVCGAAGFDAMVALARSCPAWQLTYSDLDDALARLLDEWPAVVARSRAAPATPAATPAVAVGEWQA